MGCRLARDFRRSRRDGVKPAGESGRERRQGREKRSSKRRTLDTAAAVSSQTSKHDVRREKSRFGDGSVPRGNGDGVKGACGRRDLSKCRSGSSVARPPHHVRRGSCPTFKREVQILTCLLFADAKRDTPYIERLVVV